MKVLDLRCAHDHRFEGWFGSADDYLSQRERGLVSCPVCGDGAIERVPSAPHLNVAHLRAASAGATEPASASPRTAAEPRAAAAAAASGAPSSQRGVTPVQAEARAQPVGPPQVPAARQAHWLTAVREMLARTEDVGERFPEEARRIHYGESEERLIRGQATPEERAELAEEGIQVHTLALPESLKGPLQ